MPGKHNKLLEAMQRKPTPKNLNWSDVEKLLLHFGAEMRKGSGSAVSFALGGQKLSLHRPHPQKEAKPYMITETLEFLRRAGILKE